jgi:hypothetical protein
MNCAARLVEIFGSQAEVARAFQLDRAVELEGAGNLGLATEDFYEAGSAVHCGRRLTCQGDFDNVE